MLGTGLAVPVQCSAHGLDMAEKPRQSANRDRGILGTRLAMCRETSDSQVPGNARHWASRAKAMLGTWPSLGRECPALG